MVTPMHMYIEKKKTHMYDIESWLLKVSEKKNITRKETRLGLLPRQPPLKFLGRGHTLGLDISGKLIGNI
jgi:hypothetical protein